MSAVDDLAATYQLHAADCIELAKRTSDSQGRLSLLAMARSWLMLAEQAIKNRETALVYETPTPNDPV